MATIRSLMQKDQNLTRLCIVFLAVFIICTVLKGTLFLSVNNFQSMGKQFPEFGLLAIAMAFTLYTAGIDLSVVAIANLSAVLVAKALLLLVTPETDAGTVTAIILCVFLLALLFGTLCGALNGLLIGGVGITPILATLGTQALFMGCAVVLTGGSTLGGLPPEIAKGMAAKPLGIPVPFLIFAVFAAAAAFIMERTTLGYKLRMLGRFNSAKADYGASYVMEAILIAVLGGVDPYGGKGNMKGVIVAILIVQMISSWLNMYESISNFYRQIIWGALLIFVLIYNHIVSEREKKKASEH